MEYYNVMQRHGQPVESIQHNLRAVLDYAHCQPLDSDTLNRCWALRSRFGFSTWDNQIIAASQGAGCSILHTEDLQHRQRIDELRIIDPFQDAAAASIGTRPSEWAIPNADADGLPRIERNEHRPIG